MALAILEKSVDQAGLKIRDPPASASRVLRLKVCATMPSVRLDGFGERSASPLSFLAFTFSSTEHIDLVRDTVELCKRFT